METIFLIISVVIIALILIQPRSAGFGSIAGDLGDEVVQTRRGAEKHLHLITSLLVLVFGLLAFFEMMP